MPPRIQKIRHQIFTVDKTDNIVERAAINRQSRVCVTAKASAIFFNPASSEMATISVRGNHRFAHRRVGELENAMIRRSSSLLTWCDQLTNVLISSSV